MSLDSGDARANNVYISVKLRQGAYFRNPKLGSLLHTIKKLDSDGLANAVDFTNAALKWLVDCGRATSTSVIAEKDNDTQGQCNLAITVNWATSSPVTYKTFFKVV